MKQLLRAFLATFLLSSVLVGADSQFRLGLIEPTEEQQTAIDARIPEYQIQNAASQLPSRVVNSTYLPPVDGGSQGSLGICGSICITYFTATHQLAKARGWEHPGHDGDWSHVTSPAWGVLAYPHAVAGGKPNGAAPSVVIDEIIRSGIRSYADFPYSDKMDISVFPSFEDRALALHWRAKSGVRISDVHSPEGILSIKHLLAEGNILATATKYSPTLLNYDNPDTHPDVDNEVITRKGAASTDGHALTIVGYDDNKTYTDPDTGAIKQGAFLLVNSWSSWWGVSVPEVGTGGFVWIPYELEDFLYGAFTLFFPEEDTIPDLYGDMRLTDYDGDWSAYRRSLFRWYEYCHYELSGLPDERFPDFNSYNASDSYAFAFDASLLTDATFPSVKISMISLAAEDAPEGTIAFSAYDKPSDIDGPLMSSSTEVWSYSDSMPLREYIYSPLSETIPDLGIAIERGTMATADLDADGASEFVASFIEAAPPGENFGPCRLVLGHNDGSGQFSMEALPCGDAYGQVLWADMDLDADLDIVFSSSDTTTIFVNDGSGSFTASSAELPGSGMGGASVADFNQDGRVDLVLANSDEGILLMRQLADGSFEKQSFARDIPQNYYGVDATGVAAGDVNGDGLPDFVFWDHDDSGYGNDTLILSLNTGELEFELRPLPVPWDLDGIALAFGDFNNDGCDDLAWSGGSSPEYNSRETHFGVLQGAPSGWMRAVPMQPGLKPIFGGNIAWGDINNDGALDLLISGRERDTSYTSDSNLEDANLGFYGNNLYFLSFENGYFVESGYELTGVSASTRSTLLAAMDVDADGDLDVFSAGYRGKTSETALSIVGEELCRSSIFINSFDSFTGSDSTNTSPSAPTQFSAVPSSNQITFSWM